MTKLCVFESSWLAIISKNTTNESELAKFMKTSIFHPPPYTKFAVYLPRNMPAVTKNITPQEDKPSLRVTSGAIRVSEANLLILEP